MSQRPRNEACRASRAADLNPQGQVPNHPVTQAQTEVQSSNERFCVLCCRCCVTRHQLFLPFFLLLWRPSIGLLLLPAGERQGARARRRHGRMGGVQRAQRFVRLHGERTEEQTHGHGEIRIPRSPGIKRTNVVCVCVCAVHSTRSVVQ